MWRVQSIVSFVNRSPRAMTAALRLMDHQRFVDWSFDHYLKIAPPSFVSQGRPPAASGERDEHQRRSTPAGSAA
jgi:hypothetical protein